MNINLRVEIFSFGRVIRGLGDKFLIRALQKGIGLGAKVNHTAATLDFISIFFDLNLRFGHDRP